MFNWILKEMVARKVERPPLIDAHLSDAAWQSSDIAAEFYDLQNARPGNATAWVVCHDDKSLYFGAICQESHWVTAQDEKTLGTTEDSLEIDISASGKLGWDYRFLLNAAGSRLDASPGGILGEAHLNWQSATRQTETGWTAEIAIPFATALPTAGNALHPGAPIPSGSVWFVRVLRHDASGEGKDESSSWTRFGEAGTMSTAIYGHLFFDRINPNVVNRSIRMIEPDDPGSYQPRNGKTINADDADLLDQGIRWPAEPAARLYYFQLSRHPDFPPKGTYSLDADRPYTAPTVIRSQGKWYWRYRMWTFDDKPSSFSKTRCFVVHGSDPQKRAR